MTHSEQELQDVLEQLAILEPTAVDTPSSAPQVLATLKQKMNQQETPSFLEIIRRWMNMSNRKTTTILATVVVLIVAAFSFPTVRAAASEFLGLFRVQKFSAISISPEQIAILEQLGEEGLVPGEFEIISEPGEMALATTLREAANETGLDAHTIASLGRPDGIYVTGGGSGRFIIDAAASQKILETVGADPTLIPNSVDGDRIDVVISAGIQQEWANGTFLVQMESPIVQYPDSLDPAVLGEALLQVLGMSEAEAQRLAKSIDWTSTLLLPVPTDVASFNEVTIQGESGLALTSLQGGETVLLWQKDGMVYVLGGSSNANTLVRMANAIR